LIKLPLFPHLLRAQQGPLTRRSPSDPHGSLKARVVGFNVWLADDLDDPHGWAKVGARRK
jgi:hypothetical protein